MERLSFSNLLLIVAFAFNLGLGLLVFLKRSPHRRINVSFALFSWACSGWILAVLMIYLFRDPSWRLLWVKMSFLGPSLIPAAFLSFAIIFPREDRKLNPTHMILIALPSALFFILSFTPWMVRSVQWETLTATYGIAHSIFSVYFLSFMGGGILFLIRSYKRSVGVDRIQIK
jgi:hypothetical protein